MTDSGFPSDRRGAPTPTAARPGAETDGTPRRRRRILFQAALFLALLALVGYGFTRYVLLPAPSTTVPEFVGALGLIYHIEGQEAMADINKLHGSVIVLDKAFVAQYAGRYGGTHLKVWGGEAATQTGADDLVKRMVDGINRGGSPFTNARLERVAGRDIWQTDGPGGSFFFYRSQDQPTRVVWLTIEHAEGQIASILESALRVF